MSSLGTGLEQVQSLLRTLRQEWMELKSSWQSEDRDRFEAHVTTIENTLNQEARNLQMLKEIVEHAHREVE